MNDKLAYEKNKRRIFMSKYEQAIKLLEMLSSDEFQQFTSSEFDDAIYMAIEALERCNLVEQYRWERDIALEQLKEIGCGLGQNMDDVKKALEKADKYRWHDLRKNPDDLPEDNGYGESDYVLVLAGCFEWNHCEWACYSHSAKKWSTYEQNVFAWRYIEPFKEEEEKCVSD